MTFEVYNLVSRKSDCSNFKINITLIKKLMDKFDTKYVNWLSILTQNH